MKGKLKSNKGITLLALIITIIVLLILATVTIKLIIDNGIIDRSKNATNKYKVAEENELIQLAYSEYKMGTVEGESLSEDKDLLERYFLGEKKQGQEVIKTVDVYKGSLPYLYMQPKFKGNEIIEDARTSLTMVAVSTHRDCPWFFVKYKQNIWKISCLNCGSGYAVYTVSVEFETTISGDYKNDNDLDLLEKYFLGPDKQGQEPDKTIISNPDKTIFIENATIPDVDNSLSYVGELVDESSQYLVIKYKENYYKIFMTGDIYEGFLITNVEFLTSINKIKSSQLQVKGATVVGNENTGWTITFGKTGNVYTLASSGKTSVGIDKTEDLALLRKYFLGKDGKGKSVKEVCFVDERYEGICTDFENSVYGFKNDANTIKNAGKEITNLFTKYDYMDIKNYNIEKNDNYIKYNNVAYKVEINKAGKIISVETAYIPTGTEGQTVKYSINGKKENEKEWAILYDYGDSVEILSPESIGSLTLGENDEEAQTPGDVDKDGTANTNIDKAIYSYNNAVNRINKYAESQVTNNNKISVRSVGSKPDDPNNDNSGMYYSEELKKWNSLYNGIGKNGDENYERDLIRMIYWKINLSAGHGDSYTLDYWMASRNPSTLGRRSEFHGTRKGCLYELTFDAHLR